MRLIIGLVTKSEEKFDEFVSACSLYGHLIERIEFEEIETFLKSSTSERKIKGVIIENSCLTLPIDPDKKRLLRIPLVLANEFVEQELIPVGINLENIAEFHKMILWNFSFISLYVLEKEGVVQYKCSDYVRGYINKYKYCTSHTKYAKNTNQMKQIYGWDAIFCHHRSGLSYLEYDIKGYKVSARQNNISKVFQKLFHYSKHTDLHHEPQCYKQAVDFHNRSFAKYVKNIAEFNPSEESAINTIIRNICTNAINQGAFFRSAKNRRHNGWAPGLNLGIPFTSKPKDRIHELSYQFHDFSHFNIPDLVFNGIDTPFHRLVYITYRLMSEALTLVLADMIFVNSVFLNGGNYETYEGRKIYPVFQKMIQNNPNYMDHIEEFIHAILHASFKYCFFGDVTFFENLCGPNSDDVLVNFRNKYDSYFTADMFWTANNYDNMAKTASIYENWWNAVKYWRNGSIDLQTIDEFSDEFGLRKHENDQDKTQLLDAIFESMYQKYIRQLIVTKIDPIDDQMVLTNCYRRYMIGQCLLFFRYESCATIKPKFIMLHQELTSNELATYSVVERSRQFYNMCLEHLKDDGYVTADDVISYKDVFPPFFVPNYLTGYEEFSSNGKELKDFQRDILRI
jgi:hypothetical protein